MKHVCIPVQSAECNYGESSSNEAAFGFNLVCRVWGSRYVPGDIDDLLGTWGEEVRTGAQLAI